MNRRYLRAADILRFAGLQLGRSIAQLVIDAMADDQTR
jgi:hypothetical protein